MIDKTVNKIVFFIITAIYLIATVFVVVVPMIASPVETGYGCLMILSSVPVYFIFIAWKDKPKFVQRVMGKCNTNLHMEAHPFLFVGIIWQHTKKNPFIYKIHSSKKYFLYRRIYSKIAKINDGGTTKCVSKGFICFFLFLLYFWF